ncbi:MAG TPA: DnaJ C-terminal domain-containing protein, partial [Chloroflexota bacterium]|nr:DnaJ C-terminal domain-containing protein [Chloroflexota bacterium]
EDRFKAINEANEVLSDPDKRAIYDALGPRWREYEQYRAAGGTASPTEFARATTGAGAGGTRASGGGGRATATMSEEDLRDLFGQEPPFSDFFGDIFGGTGARSGTRTRDRAPARGADVDVPVEISLEDAYRGNTVTLRLTDPNGQDRTIEATIPRGARDGSRIRLAGQGTPGRGGGPSGDLYMVIHIRPHPLFRREGDDLHIEVPVEMTTCLLGGEVEVPTLKGTRLSVRIPPETQNGQAIRLRGQGMPHLRHPETAGDLFVEVRVVLPTHLTPEERTLIVKFAELRARTATAAGR